MVERRILIGLITSTEYLVQVKDIWSNQLLEADTARLVSSWCWEYYERYNRAPSRDIESIYFEKVRSLQIQKEKAEWIEDVLGSLSEEYNRTDFNVERLLDETKEYFTNRHLQIHKDRVEALLTAGKTEEAEKLVSEFKPLGIKGRKIDDFILSAEEIRAKDVKKPTVLLSPWLKEGQITIMYAGYGVGKSLLTILIGYVLGLKKEDYTEEKAEIGEWQVKTPAGCLYIDGELGEQEMEERIAQYEWLGRQQRDYRIKVLSVPEYQLVTEDTFYLSDKRNQQKVIRWLQAHPTYKLVVLDSVSTLFGLIDENDNSEWNNKINPFLRDLRALGVAGILLHHASKEKRRGLRGASSMGAMAQNIFRLVDHSKKSIDDGEAWFTIGKDKQRSAGYSFKTFSIHFTQTTDRKETHWEITMNN